MILPKFMVSPVTKVHVERKILQKTHPRHMFRIIKDIDSYQEFVPFCWDSKVLKRHDGNDNHPTKKHVFDATLTVGMPPIFEETYVSTVTALPEQLTIETQSFESKLFDSIRSQWILKDVSSESDKENGNVATDVRCEVELTVSDPIMVNTIDSFLHQVAQKQIEAFEARSREQKFDPAVDNEH